MLYTQFLKYSKNQLKQTIEKYYTSKGKSFAEFLYYFFLLLIGSKSTVKEKINRQKKKHIINVKIGDIPAHDIEEQKIKRFTNLFKTVILIDNSRHTKSLEQIDRGICVLGLEPKL